MTSPIPFSEGVPTANQSSCDDLSEADTAGLRETAAAWLAE